MFLIVVQPADGDHGAGEAGAVREAVEEGGGDVDGVAVDAVGVRPGPDAQELAGDGVLVDAEEGGDFHDLGFVRGGGFDFHPVSCHGISGVWIAESEIRNLRSQI
ncbi:hypothetical protein KBB96_09370 [Luteolibacter ambystomatis]|uniref:Uncharacterized protein n=1 Tax=Luteolibacter ambystomatis TaxID=2824561 RepID=A0A975J316_9BACT|nr:hypothetical protein [Luteolibacter ambystomatis]QUE53088.1 hypothetical protein KBB96_09370 [Luteolibacter ambystomatis]